MHQELSRIFSLAFLGFLVVVYGAIEACSWLSRRFSGASGSALSVDDDLARR
jgi:hypothetical protein